MIRKWLAIGIILLFLGTCLIPATAQDENPNLEIPIPPMDEKQKNRILFFSIIIKNTGDTDLQNVFWSVDMGGPHLLYPRKKLSDSVDVLKTDETFVGRVMMFGFGLVSMHLMYGVKDIVTHDKVLVAVIIGPIIILLIQTFP